MADVSVGTLKFYQFAIVDSGFDSRGVVLIERLAKCLDLAVDGSVVNFEGDYRRHKEVWSSVGVGGFGGGRSISSIIALFLPTEKQYCW